MRARGRDPCPAPSAASFGTRTSCCSPAANSSRPSASTHDAVLFVDPTAYQPYRPIALGIRAKLATIGDHRLVWSFDEVFFASNPAVDNAVRRFYIDSGGGPMPLDMTAAALQSPTKFAAYAADAAFKTLPPR